MEAAKINTFTVKEVGVTGNMIHIIKICRTAIKVLLLYFKMCLSVKLDSLSCSFASISFLTN